MSKLKRLTKARKMDLVWSARSGDIEGVRKCLNEGVDVNYCNEHDGTTALHEVSGGRGCAKWFECAVMIADLLISKGADVNKKDRSGYTALHAASCSNNVKIIDMLLSKGADIEAKNLRGNTALHAASHWGHVDAVKSLLFKGANIECTDNEGCTPLYHVINYGNPSGLILTKECDMIETTKVLLAHGAIIGEKLPKRNVHNAEIMNLVEKEAERRRLSIKN